MLKRLRYNNKLKHIKREVLEIKDLKEILNNERVRIMGSKKAKVKTYRIKDVKKVDKE
jgi:hypothetical protein